MYRGEAKDRLDWRHEAREALEYVTVKMRKK
jgi:hypothetical protein